MDAITYLFDSKAKDLIFFCLFLQVFLESGSESFNSIFLNLFFFLLSRVIEDGLSNIHFNFLTSVHFSLLNLVSFCNHRAYLLLPLPPEFRNILCYLLLKSQSGNQHFLVSRISLTVPSVSSRILSFPLGPKDIIPFPHSLNKLAHISLK